MRWEEFCTFNPLPTIVMRKFSNHENFRFPVIDRFTFSETWRIWKFQNQGGKRLYFNLFDSLYRLYLSNKWSERNGMVFFNLKDSTQRCLIHCQILNFKNSEDLRNIWFFLTLQNSENFHINIHNEDYLIKPLQNLKLLFVIVIIN